MNWPAITDAVLIGTIAVLLIYEVIVIAATKDGDSISWQISTAAFRHPFIAFLAGFLSGHLFWQMSN